MNLGDLLTRESTPGAPRIATADAWPERRREIEARILAILGPFPETRCPLAPTVESEIMVDGVLRRGVVYEVEPGERIAAWLLVPKERTAPGPAILCLHQTTPLGKDEPVGLRDGLPDLAYARELAHRGYVTLTPDHPTANERAYPGLRSYRSAPFYEQRPHWSTFGKLIWDATRALDYLQSLPIVDGERLGCIGHSLGGHGALFTAAFDRRVRAAVSSCGWQPFAADFRKGFDWCHAESFNYMPRLRPYFEREEAPFDLHEVIALVAPRAFLDTSATNDPGFSLAAGNTAVLDQVREVYRLFDAADRLDGILHDDGHGFPRPVRDRAYAWFDRWLNE